MAIVQRDVLLSDWREVCSTLHYAFQPLVSTHTGRTFGFEALLRGWNEAGFTSIAHLFDRADEDGVIVEVNTMLLEQAISRYLERIPDPGPAGVDGERSRLFFNLDNRVFHDPDAADRIHNAIRRTGIPPELLSFEISERNELPSGAYDPDQLPSLRGTGVQIALDDFGAGYSGLQVLYQAKVDIIKIDRFFVEGIDRDATKRIFVTSLVNLAHSMGQRVVAEGVETKREYYVSREIGCDYIQGYLVARPDASAEPLKGIYTIIEQLISADRRSASSNEQILLHNLSPIEPITTDTPILDVLKRFRSEPETTIVPVVTGDGEPLGIIREQDLKTYVYSPYGISLLMNRTYRNEFYSYLRRVPVVPIHVRIDRILQIYAMDSDAEALIVTEGGRYRGCLDSKALLQILHQREVATARDQNPLTRLPGNTIITEYLSAVFKPNPSWNVLVYIDFNHFKPFNDTYGFRVGDRIIQLFGDLLRSEVNERSAFAGHIGGDDFFLAFEATDAEISTRIDNIRRLVERFRQDVLPFYSAEDSRRGYIEGHDREGNPKRFEMLSAAAAILLIPPHDGLLPFRELGREISLLKLTAKGSEDHLVIASIVPSTEIRNASQP
ncbi:MAG: bifunctional diguanylate cyclase/phosphodiesterase [Alkalispirochaeta sp.]